MSAQAAPWAHVVSVSGGKDSTALYLLALERMQAKGREFIPVFADTGNEHEATYEAVHNLARLTNGPEVRWVKADLAHRVIAKRDYISAHWQADLTTGKPGEWKPVFLDLDGSGEHPEPPPPPRDLYSNASEPGWKWVPGVEPLSADEAAEIVATALEVLVPTGNPFLDMALWKGRFPSTKARFCTEELKVFPIAEQVYRPLISQGRRIISWQGVRAEESRARALLKPWQRLEQEDMPILVYRPLLRWKLADVWAMHERHSVPRNPLYDQGMGRVGCMPCIMAKKDEIRAIAARFPEHIDRIEKWERLTSLAAKRRSSTFFSYDKTPGAHVADPSLPMPGIRDVVEWSRTSRGGVQYDLTLDPSIEFGTACNQWGACE